jgi:hypothetical protein
LPEHRDAPCLIRSYDLLVLRTDDRAADPPELAELDRIDDELFSTDYWPPTQRRHLTLLPEPPTERLRARAVPARLTPPDPPTVRVRPPDPPTVRLSPPDPPTVRMRPPPSALPGSPYTTDENGTEVAALIGLAIMLVVTVVTVAIMLWLWV